MAVVYLLKLHNETCFDFRTEVVFTLFSKANCFLILKELLETPNNKNFLGFVELREKFDSIINISYKKFKTKKYPIII